MSNLEPSDIIFLRAKLLDVSLEFEDRVRHRAPPEIVLPEVIGGLLSLAAFLAVNNTNLRQSDFIDAARKAYVGWIQKFEEETSLR